MADYRKKKTGQSNSKANRKNGQATRLNMSPALKAPTNHDEERAQFAGFARHAEPWHAGILIATLCRVLAT